MKFIKNIIDAILNTPSSREIVTEAPASMPDIPAHLTKYVRRLTEEWNKHGKIIIAVDFDDTVSPWNLNSFEDCEKVLQILRDVKQAGAYIVVFTACNADRYEAIKKYLHDKRLEVDSINKNPIDLPYGHSSKVYANIFIDDRAGLHESLEILKESMYRHRSYVRSRVPLDEIG